MTHIAIFKRVLVASLVAASLGGKVVAGAEFSAELHTTDQGPKETYRYRARGDAYRIEKLGPDGRRPVSATVIDPSRKLKVIIHFMLRQYAVIPWQEDISMIDQIAAWRMRLEGLEPKATDQVDLDGRACRHEVFGAEGDSQQEVWTDIELEHTLRHVIHGANGDLLLTLDNIDIAPQDAALFSIPKGYRKTAPPKLKKDEKDAAQNKRPRRQPADIILSLKAGQSRGRSVEPECDVTVKVIAGAAGSTLQVAVKSEDGTDVLREEAVLAKNERREWQFQPEQKLSTVTVAGMAGDATVTIVQKLATKAP